MPDSATIEPRLRLRRICKRFGATVALDDVDLDVAPGEVHAVIGENGAGKSTLMKVLSGAHQPDSGEMALDGAPLSVGNPRDALDAGIAMIYQELNLAPDVSVAENISLGREPHRAGWIDRSTQHRIAFEALGRLHRADLPLDAPVRDLSLAQRQMVEIARAVRRPPGDAAPLRLLILDEPTSSLTQVDVENLFEVIGRIKQDGVSILYISHFLEECVRVADRFTVLRDGRTVGAGRMDRTSLDDVIHMMVGRKVSELYPSFTHEPGEPVLGLENVAGATRPRNVSLTVRKGEIFGVAGLVGGGRTEMVRAVFGLDRLKEGCVVVHGRETRRRDPAASWGRENMGLVSEDRKNEGLLLNRSLEENLTLTRSMPYRRGLLLQSNRMRDAAREWMRRLDIRAAGPDQAVGELSGGNQQKVAFGRLLHHDCSILLLDEPTRGIDIGSKATLYRCIGELAASGKAILLISSYLPELLGICDTIGVVSRGRLVAVKPRSEWDMHSLLTAAVGHEDATPATTSPPYE